MRSRRIPALHSRNAWSLALEARRASGAPIVDLTEGNPTRVGLAGLEPEELAALADPRAARYEPAPLGLPEARAAVAEDLASRGVPAHAADVVLTAGTSEAYAHLLRLLADPGDCVLAPVPSYPLFEPLAALEGVRLRPYRLAWDGAWHLDRGDLDRALEARPRAVIVVQPNVPTGSWLDAEDRDALVARCAERGIALIADEVFADFAWPPRSAPLAGFAGRDEVPTFVLGGLSKSCGMPQLKLSWILVSGPADSKRRALEGLEWISDLFLSVGTPVQLALPRLLAAGDAFRRRVRERLATNLGRLGSLERRAPEATRIGGAGGWSAVLRLPARRTGEEWAMALLARGVAAHPGELYDLEGGSHLALSLIPEPAVFDAGLAGLETLLGAR